MGLSFYSEINGVDDPYTAWIVDDISEVLSWHEVQDDKVLRPYRATGLNWPGEIKYFILQPQNICLPVFICSCDILSLTL